MDNFMTWSTQGYVTVFGYFFWPIIFAGVIGYVYLKQQSAVSAAAAVIILFAGFVTTGIFADVDVLVQFFQIMVALAFTGLIILFLARGRP